MGFGSKFSFVAGIACLCAFSNAAFAGDNLYFGGSLTASTVSDFDFKNNNANAQARTVEFDHAVGGEMRFGHDYGNIRAELEVGAKTVSVDAVNPGSNATGDIGIYTAMINGAYDYDTGTRWVPYVGAGVGVMAVEGDISYVSSSNGVTVQDKNVFGVAPAAQLKIGTAFAISEEVDFIGGYGLMAAPTDDANEDNTILLHSFTIGMNYNF